MSPLPKPDDDASTLMEDDSSGSERNQSRTVHHRHNVNNDIISVQQREQTRVGVLSVSPTSVSSSFVSLAVDVEAVSIGPPAKNEGQRSSLEEKTLRQRHHPRPWATPLPASEKSQRTRNPIRAIVDSMIDGSTTSSSSNASKKKDLISLALGDPTATDSTVLTPCPVAIQAVQDVLLTTTSSSSLDHPNAAAASYVNALGTMAARTAIAAYHSSSSYSISADTVIVANGCSGALELALTALLDPNTILLVPEPGFPLYQVIAESHGARVVHYRLLPDQEWQIDLHHVDALLTRYNSNNNTDTTNIVRGIVVNNPSNPTGAVYSTQHLQDIVRLCNVHQIPIVADEVYGDIVFDPQHKPFVPLATIATQLGRTVPVITASGIGKQYLLPGWRVGWICFQDNIYASLSAVEAGAKHLAQVILGASHLAQTAVPALLTPAPQSSDTTADGSTTDNSSNATYLEIVRWKHNLRTTLQQQAHCLCTALSQIEPPCLQVLPPQGAMYAMVRINMEYFAHNNKIQNDMDFAKLLLQEENVMVLPGICFGMTNSFRVVFCAPVPVLQEAAHRIQQFCHRHCGCVPSSSS